MFGPAELAARAAALPVVTYPDLPVSDHRQEIATAIQRNQVVVIAGETGSGKTTQIPKICLALGRGISGMIGHTQPRRLAARSVASRIAEELGQTVGKAPGQVVGFQVRFVDDVGPTTLIKLMTDGILLNEIQSDPDLLKYDTIIVDEAHERSLNIDFILGYLAELLPRRPDLKLIITSATIDSERFARHFGQDVPVIEVSGRTYPVEARYREEADEEELDSLLVGAVDELLDEPDGDILVFLPGERDIREATQLLEDHLIRRNVEVIPLYARLSTAEQQRIFQPAEHRRIILSTNIAETSLTVPGIRFVIDSGLARVSRFSNKTKVQRLPIEKVSQASASQRAGRAGRVAPGIAIRLYSEEDFESRDQYTEPEILRTSLASVILQMKSLGLGEVADFPFIDPPSRQAVRDGVQLLVELGALTDQGELTKLGAKLARLPIDPRLGRMLLAAHDHGCASEVLVIVAALSIQDIRERPLEHKAAADASHARLANPDSDFLTYLNLWRYLNVQSRDLSHSAFRRLCRSEFFHFLRWREWRDIVTQLRSMCQEIGMKVDTLGLPDRQEVKQSPDAASAVVAFGTGSRAVDYEQVHLALLTGLLSNIGNWDQLKKNYQGTRGARFVIWPGSGLAGSRPDWVMAAELVETSRLFARTAARIKPDWIEKTGTHLLTRSYAEPYWSRAKGAAMIKERISLYGLTLAADRSILLASLGSRQFTTHQQAQSSVARPGTIAAIAQGLLANASSGGWLSGLARGDDAVSATEMAYEMFIRNALVDGKWRADYLPFVRHNKKMRARAEEMATRLRDPGLVIDEGQLEQFFTERVPPTVTSARAFEKWWKSQDDKHVLDLQFRDVFDESSPAQLGDFPDVWQQGSLNLKVSYPANGPVTISVPLALLPQLKNEGFDWLVPGLFFDLCVATLRGLPKPIRRQVGPAPGAAQRIIQFLKTDPAVSTVPVVEAPAAAAENLDASLQRLAEWGSRSGAVIGAPRAATSPTPPEPSEVPSPPIASEPSSLVDGPFAVALSATLKHIFDLDVPAETIEAVELPRSLQIRFVAVDERGKTVASSYSLPSLQRELSKTADRAVSKVVKDAVRQAVATSNQTSIEKRNLSTFPAEIPRQVESQGPRGAIVRGYPALVKDGDDVHLLMHGTIDEAQADHSDGVAALLLRELRLPTGRVTTRWTGSDALVLAASPYGSTEELVADAQWAAARALTKPVRTSKEFSALVATARGQFEDQVHQILKHCVRALSTGENNDRLLYPGFLSATPPEYLTHLPRYIRASASSQVTDRKKLADLRTVENALSQARTLASKRPYSVRVQERLTEIDWLIEELRVSLFAQQLGTAKKVSKERILRKIDDLFRD